MPTYQVVWNGTTRQAAIQNQGASPPAGSLIAGTFVDDNGPFVPNISDVLYHAVRDVLYGQGIYDMQRLSILSGNLPPVAPGVLTITGPVTLNGSASGSQQFARTGGTAPFTWAIVPAVTGFSINSSGLLTWSNQTVGAKNINIRINDATLNDNHAVTVNIAAAAANSKARFGYGTSNAAVANPAALIASMTEMTNSVNNTVVGTLVGAPPANAFVWAAVPAAPSANGVVFMTSLGPGGWQGTDELSGDFFDDPGLTKNTSNVTAEVNGILWRFFRTNSANAANTWTISAN